MTDKRLYLTGTSFSGKSTLLDCLEDYLDQLVGPGLVRERLVRVRWRTREYQKLYNRPMFDEASAFDQVATTLWSLGEELLPPEPFRFLMRDRCILDAWAFTEYLVQGRDFSEGKNQDWVITHSLIADLGRQFLARITRFPERQLLCFVYLREDLAEKVPESQQAVVRAVDRFLRELISPFIHPGSNVLALYPEHTFSRNFTFLVERCASLLHFPLQWRQVEEFASAWWDKHADKPSRDLYDRGGK